jgi:prepilin-type processing-associated H-X9-DG protein
VTEELISHLTERLDSQYFGKFRGTVVDNKDPQKRGRLRVRVPSVLTDDPSTVDSDETVTDWALPCVPFGGASEQGFFVVPEPGAHVWVEFEEGHLDQPIWTGTFWLAPGGTTEVPTEAQDMAGTQNDLEPKRRVIKTASGHVLQFSDVPSKEAITLVHKNGSLLQFDEKGSVFLYSKEGSFLYMNVDSGEVTLAHSNGANISMADGQVSITNDKGTSVSLVDDAVQVNATSVAIRSQTVSLCEGANQPVILGQAFATIFDAHTHNCTALGAPSGPPLPPGLLSMPMSTALSQCVKVK